jgi:hypothetical protein
MLLEIKQKDYVVASIPKLQSALNFFMNAIFIC